MNIYTLLTTLRDAVHDDSNTQTWCTAQYERNHKVYVGIDTRKPPGEDEYPLVHLFPISKQGGYDAERLEHGIGVTCGVHNATAATTGKANVVEYVGMEHIETFRKHVETAIAGAVPTGHDLVRFEADFDTLDFFPFFLATQEYIIGKDLYQGDDPLA